jgi:ubiquinone/menaquinone biosynthesis C-methylase UbiE
VLHGASRKEIPILLVYRADGEPKDGSASLHWNFIDPNYSPALSPLASNGALAFRLGDEMTESIHERFGAVDDSRWAQLMMRSLDEPVIDGVEMPRFPSEEEQRLFVGQAREAALAEALAFFRIVKEACAKAKRPLGRATRLLDFGVGWGRIVRMFLKDIPAENIVGVDVNEHILARCRELVPGPSYELGRYGQPLSAASASVDLVTAFSVFSHLSPTAQLEWLTELHRVMKPDAIAVITTLSSRFVDTCRAAVANPNQSPWHREIATLVETHLPKAGRSLAAWDFSRMLYLPSGGGLQGLDAQNYGWAMVPETYARRAWGEWFDVRDFVDQRDRLEQAYFVLVRK